MRSLSSKLGVVISCGVLAAVLNLGAAKAGENCRIAFLGDSLSAGYGLAAAESFPARMADRLEAAGYACEVLNAGLSGDTTAGGAARVGWLLADEPSHVVVALGGNDGLRAVPPAEVRANLEAILDQLDAAGVRALVAGMLAPPNLGADYGRRFEAAFEEVAAAHDAAFYPFLLDGVAGRPALNQPDGIHPTARGVEVMVERIWPTFARWLETTGVVTG